MIRTDGNPTICTPETPSLPAQSNADWLQQAELGPEPVVVRLNREDVAMLQSALSLGASAAAGHPDEAVQLRRIASLSAHLQRSANR